MCATCGCSTHEHQHDEKHEHAHAHSTVVLEREILARNTRLAEQNLVWLTHRGILALNLVSSPGAGKTTLLEKTIKGLGGDYPLAVIEGDQQTSLDAERIRACGCPAVQVNTGAGCHLDAAMISRALEELHPRARSLVLIENVGNLICPALFDLGEHAKVVIASVTEGEDKPLKYPHMFRAGRIVLLNKVDLLPHVRFDVRRFEDNLALVNPRAQLLPVSAIDGQGLDMWYTWIKRQFTNLENDDELRGVFHSGGEDLRQRADGLTTIA